MNPSTERLEQIADMYAAHRAQLHRVVLRRGTTSDAIAEDACSFAWMQLLTHDYVELEPPRWGALAWLTQTALHQAWKLNATERRAHAAALASPEDLDEQRSDSAQAAPSAGEVAEQRMRLDLIAEIPERPRRFLLRLALGYSYDEIGAAEGASYTTVSKQIARAKRLLRDLEHAQSAGGE